MTTLDELQKALDQVEAIVWATCEFGSLGREKMNVLLYQFSMFKDEYVGQVHVSELSLAKERSLRKLLEHFPFENYKPSLEGTDPINKRFMNVHNVYHDWLKRFLKVSEASTK